jgi:methanogenic corrinoid protein MtbC1
MKSPPSSPSAFAAALLDSTLSAQAAGVALCLRERLGAPALAALGSFEELSGDARVRLQYLAEALALAHPEIYLQHVDWLRGAYTARGLGDEVLRASHACLRVTLRAGLPAPAFAEIERVLALEEQALAQPWCEPPDALAGPHGTAIARLLEQVLAGQRAAALASAQELTRELGEETFVEHVLVGVQRELGRLWQRGEIHVGEEHLGSRVTEEILARLPALSVPAPNARRVLVASTAGDLHEIGARMVARAFERKGWEVCFLGANVPRLDLAHALQDLAPGLLALSVTLGIHLRGAAAMIASAHALQPRVPVLVGGPTFRRSAELALAIGADALALDAVSAEREASRLVG